MQRARDNEKKRVTGVEREREREKQFLALLLGCKDAV